MLLGSHKVYTGKCVDISGEDMHEGEHDLGQKSSKEECLAGCKENVFAHGCEYYEPKGKCTRHDSPKVDSGKGHSNYTCAIISGNILVKIQTKLHVRRVSN